MSVADTVTVPHLGSSTIGYALAAPYDASLPTLVLSNSFTTSVDLYRPQFADEELRRTANLLAIEPYGHGSTRAGYADYTYWDSAAAALRCPRRPRHRAGVRARDLPGRLDRRAHGAART